MLPKKNKKPVTPIVESPEGPIWKTAARPHQRYSQAARAATCLVQVLEHHGLAAPFSEIKEHLSASPYGNDVINFLDVAERYGLLGRPIVLTTPEWQNIQPATILHWGADNLVVFESYATESVVVFDPLIGTHRMDVAEFRRQFTGVALVFEVLLPG